MSKNRKGYMQEGKAGSELRTGNILENIELPSLRNNPNVTHIITIDPKTEIEMTILER